MTTADVESLRKIFRETIEAVLESGVGCPPGLDFDSPRLGLAPGNLWDPPSEWQSPHKRESIGEFPATLDEHPSGTELIEGFRAADYVDMNPDLGANMSDEQAFEHFVSRGYRERRPYSKTIWESVSPLYYKQHCGLDSSDESDLRMHYGYIGRFEDRFPNDLTAWVANTRIQLWQMGKVGSLSIQQALREQWGEHSVHLHFLDAWHRDSPTIGVHYSRMLHHHGYRPKLIICGVRDPIERVVSGYFQEAESRGVQDTAFGCADDAVRRLAGRMVQDLWVICDWFGHRFFADRSVYSVPFDQDAGFVEHDAGEHRVWLYRQDRLRWLTGELAGSLGYPEISFPSTNVSSSKRYAEMYRLVKSCVDLPDSLADRLYASEYARHFGFERIPSREGPAQRAKARTTNLAVACDGRPQTRLGSCDVHDLPGSPYPRASAAWVEERPASVPLPGEPRWPTFLVIGAPRCGTTSLYHMLRQHPGVHVPALKEVNFFALRAMGIDLDALSETARLAWGPCEADPDRYRALFAASNRSLSAYPAAGQTGEGGVTLGISIEPTAFGECSPTYLNVGETARVIRDTVPSVRLIAILRDPAHRAVSHHARRLRIGTDSESDFVAALAKDDQSGPHASYVRPGLYAARLMPYFKLFPREQILLLSYDDLAADPRGLMRRVFGHIGVDPDHPTRPEHRLKSDPAGLSPGSWGLLRDRFREDTRRLVHEFGFEQARVWSTYR